MKKLYTLLISSCLLLACQNDVDENNVCGNGIVEADEECDGEDNCNELCYQDRIVFLTSQCYDANFGGIGGADHMCYIESQKFGNTDPTRFRAIIGTDNSSPIDRLNNHNGRIVDLRGEIVVEWGLNDFFDGELLHSINETPTQTGVIDYVFTGIDEHGEAVSGMNCNNWTSLKGAVIIGKSDYLNANAFDKDGYNEGCEMCARLYCMDMKGGPIR